MNNLPSDLIKYDLNKFLTLNEKIALRLTNKKLNRIQKKSIYYHIGEILAKKIGINKSDDYLIIREYNFEFMKDIVEIIFEKEKNRSINPKKIIAIGNLIKIKTNDKNSCIDLIRANKLKYNNYYNSIYKNTNFLKNHFYQTYALI